VPHELSSFVGRGAQLDDIASRLLSDRLVTLTGGGGIGKTRLALQVARRLKMDNTACAWAALSAVTDDAGVATAVASALFNVEPVRSMTVEALASAIRDQKFVLILDNCEQVIGACAELTLQLLQACPGIRVLATSREPLGVPGETVYPVPPLAVTNDPDDSEAVQLFFHRALARDPRLPLTPEARAIAVRICSACDGVPLAIELAAACTVSMTLPEIVDRLEDALGLLRLGSRAAPARQHSLRASIDWSHRLLQTTEQLLLRRLAIFDADFTLSAAEAVCAFDGLPADEIAYLLHRLVTRSLVHASRNDSTTRFCLWLPVRQYCLERLEQAGEAARVRARWGEWSDARRARAAEPLQPTGAKSRGRHRGVLSEREHHVVQLIAGGRSNREIADELVITKKTAEAHVSHILTKLGLGSRVQIATWSLQHGAGPHS
jgi:predicted ATPase